MLDDAAGGGVVIGDGEGQGREFIRDRDRGERTTAIGGDGARCHVQDRAAVALGHKAADHFRRIGKGHHGERCSELFERRK